MQLTKKIMSLAMICFFALPLFIFAGCNTNQKEDETTITMEKARQLVDTACSYFSGQNGQVAQVCTKIVKDREDFDSQEEYEAYLNSNEYKNLPTEEWFMYSSTMPTVEMLNWDESTDSVETDYDPSDVLLILQKVLKESENKKGTFTFSQSTSSGDITQYLNYRLTSVGVDFSVIGLASWFNSNRGVSVKSSTEYDVVVDWRPDLPVTNEIPEEVIERICTNVNTQENEVANRTYYIKDNKIAKYEQTSFAFNVKDGDFVKNVILNQNIENVTLDTTNIQNSEDFASLDCYLRCCVYFCGDAINHSKILNYYHAADGQANVNQPIFVYSSKAAMLQQIEKTINKAKNITETKIDIDNATSPDWLEELYA